MTLEAIRVTQSDRDLFKHLISEATNYVAADYMRHANERRVHLDKALEFRRELHTSRQQLAAEQYKHVDMARELAEHNGAEGDLEADYQAASDHLNWCKPHCVSRRRSNVTKQISMSCRSVWKSKTKWWQKPSNARRERSARRSRRTGSGRAEKPACRLPAGAGRPANARDPVQPGDCCA